MYLGDVATGVTIASIIIFIITGITALISFCVSFEEHQSEKAIQKVTKVFKVSSTFALLFLFLSIVTPSKTVFYAFAAVSAGTYVAQTELGQMSIELIEQKLKEALESNNDERSER